MRITRIYTGEDGRSHFEDVELRLTVHGVFTSATERLPATTVTFGESSRGGELDFHVAPNRQFVIHLAGSQEIECGDDERRTFRAGDIFFAEDRTGQGHISRTHAEPTFAMVVVKVDDDFDLDALRA